MKTPFAVPFLAAALFASTSAQAADALAVTDLNMRAGPGPQYPLVTTIANSGAVDVHGCLQSWCDVSWDGVRGWAYANYLAFNVDNQPVPIPEIGTRVEVPAATFEGEAYWTENYADRPFYGERERYVGSGAAPGAVTGAIAGAVVGGPIGAAVGGVAGAVVGDTIAPPEQVRTYVMAEPVEPVLLEGEVVVGAAIPEPVVIHTVPDYEYRYAVVNGQTVLVDPATRQIVYVYR